MEKNVFARSANGVKCEVGWGYVNLLTPCTPTNLASPSEGRAFDPCLRLSDEDRTYDELNNFSFVTLHNSIDDVS